MAFAENVNPNLANMRPEVYARMLQEVYQASSIVEQVASVSAEKEMNFGDVYHRPTIAGQFSGIKPLNVGDDIAASPIGSADETLTIDRYFGDRFLIPEVQSVLDRFNLRKQFGSRKMQELALHIDADCLGHVAKNAASRLDAGDFTGQAGDPLALSGTNVEEIVPAMISELAHNSVMTGERIGIVTPDFMKVLTNQTQGRATSFGDDVLRNGFNGNVIRHQDFVLYSSTNVPTSYYLDTTANPADGETLTLPTGLVVTFKNVVAAKKQILIGADTAATFANLKAFIEDPTTAGSHLALDAVTDHTDLVLLGFGKKFQVTSNDLGGGAAETEFYMLGGGLRAKKNLAENMANSEWNSDKHSQHMMFGTRGFIELARPIAPKISIVSADMNPTQQTEIVKLTALYGREMFSDQKTRAISLRAAL